MGPAPGIPDCLLKDHISFPYTADPGNARRKASKPWKRLFNERANRSLPTRGGGRGLRDAPVTRVHLSGAPVAPVCLSGATGTCCNRDVHRSVSNAAVCPSAAPSPATHKGHLRAHPDSCDPRTPLWLLVYPSFCFLWCLFTLLPLLSLCLSQCWLWNLSSPRGARRALSTGAQPSPAKLSPAKLLRLVCRHKPGSQPGSASPCLQLCTKNGGDTASPSWEDPSVPNVFPAEKEPLQPHPGPVSRASSWRKPDTGAAIAGTAKGGSSSPHTSSPFRSAQLCFAHGAAGGLHRFGQHRPHQHSPGSPTALQVSGGEQSHSSGTR